jgi:hypothetical protein
MQPKQLPNRASLSRQCFGSLVGRKANGISLCYPKGMDLYKASLDLYQALGNPEWRWHRARRIKTAEGKIDYPRALHDFIQGGQGLLLSVAPGDGLDATELILEGLRAQIGELTERHNLTFQEKLRITRKYGTARNTFVGTTEEYLRAVLNAYKQEVGDAL